MRRKPLYAFLDIKKCLPALLVLLFATGEPARLLASHRPTREQSGEQLERATQMKRALLCTLLIVAIATGASAQTGNVCIYSDALGSQCNFVDGVGLQQFYVFLIDAPGATAVGFSAPVTPCMAGMSWLSDTGVWPVTVGDSQDGVSVGFGACLSSPIHVLTINYFSNGIVGSDCAYPVLADPNAPSGPSLPEWVDCTQTLRTANTGTAYINSALGCSCDLQEPVPTLSVTPTNMAFLTSENTKTLSVRNIGIGQLNWALTASDPWIQLNPNGGVGDADVNVTINRSILSTGTHVGSIYVSSNGGTATVVVTVQQGGQGAPTLAVNPTSLTYESGQVQKSVRVTNSGGGVLDFTITPSAPWLTTTPTGGSITSLTPVSIQVDVNRAGLATGAYNGQLFITSNGGFRVVSVTMIVIAGPILDVNPNALTFDPSTSSLGLTIENVGIDILNWSIAPDQPWLDATPPGGATATSISVNVTVDRTGLPDGIYFGNLNITSDGGSALVPITLHVLVNPELSVAPTALFFAAGVDQKALTVRNLGVNILNWSAAPDQTWVTVVPAAGAQPAGPGAVAQVIVDRSSLAHGTHNANVEFTSDGGNQTVPITVEVITDPIIKLTPPTITFTTSQNSKAFLITNIGAGQLGWSISENIDWLSFGLTSGTGDATVVGTVDVPNAPQSASDETVTINSNGGDAILTVLWRPSVGGGAGTIGIFTDIVGADACIDDPDLPGLLTVHIVHTNTIGAAASQFWAPIPICYTGATYLSDTPVYGVTLGNSQIGVAIGYGACRPTPNHILSINIFTTSSIGQTCCAWSVLPDPNVPSGHVEVVDCSNNLVFGNGLTSFVSEPPCNCGIGVRTEVTTWGEIKSIYQSEDQMHRVIREQR